MGHIDKLYYRTHDLPPSRKMGKQIWLDIGENIHLHYRDLRIEFSLEEFLEFAGHIRKMAELFDQWRRENPDWKEDPEPEKFDNKWVIWLPGYKPQDEHLKPRSDYYPKRLSIEKQATKDLYHIHYRDFRLEMSEETLRRFVEGFRRVLP
jgi:hypothetical protein